MIDTIYIQPYNAVHCTVTASNEGLEYELSEVFCFTVQGHKWMPAFKSGYWDGKIRLYNPVTKLVYRGLLARVIRWAKERDYQVELDDALVDDQAKLTDSEISKFVDSLNLPITPRDYQIEYFRRNCFRQRIVTDFFPS